VKKIFILCFFFLLSCQSGRDQWVILPSGERLFLPYEQTLSAVITSEPPSIDWLTSSDTNSSWIEEHLMDGLVGFDLRSQELNPKPALARHWEVSDDGLTWTFLLRDDVYWSDGELLTSQHVVDAFMRILKPETAAIAVDNLFVIENAYEFNSGGIDDFEMVGVRKLGDHSLSFKLKQPMAFFPMLMTHHTTFPIRLDIIEKHGDRWTEPENIVTLGPYRLAYWHHDSRMVLMRNPNYWGEVPKIKFLIFYIVDRNATQLRMFERGKIDFIRDLPSSEIARLSQKEEYRTSPGLRLYYYGFKVNKKPFNDVRMRKAVSHAIDRREVVKILGGGQKPLHSWIPLGLPGHSNDVGLAFDIKKAKKYYQQALVDYKKPPRITLGFNSDEKHKRVAENIQSQLKRNLGMKIELMNEEWKTFLNGLRGRSSYSFFRLGWVADYPDPHTFMAIMSSYAPNNRTGWKSQRYDQLLNEAMNKLDKTQRIAIYHKAQKHLLEEEVPVLPLFTDVNHVLVSNRVKGFHPNVLDIYHFHLMEIVQ
jgi:oligopeptide transport system substrate-binding protein